MTCWQGFLKGPTSESGKDLPLVILRRCEFAALWDKASGLVKLGLARIMHETPSRSRGINS
jgi:hypothetical protein